LCASCTNQTVDNIAVTTNTSSIALSQDLPNDELQDELQKGVDTDNLNKLLAVAIKNQDYRLLATSTRALNIPGVNPRDYQSMIKLCGKKYSTAGDVITSEEQRTERKKLLNTMRQYNEKILIICQEQKKYK
jgi:hypothetical protein